MKLTLDLEQQELVRTARKLLSTRYPLDDTAERVRAEADPRALLAEAVDLGWTAIPLPESHGGLGATVLDLALVYEELGRAAVATPLDASIALVAIPLARTAPRSAAFVADLVEGRTLATLAVLEEGMRDEWARRSLTAAASGDGWTVSGVLAMVPWGAAADTILVVVDLEGRGPRLLSIAGGASGLATRSLRVVGGSPSARVVLDGMHVTEADVVLDSQEEVEAFVTTALDTAMVLGAAQAVGACESALQLSVTWAKDRRQFGRPIGSFQAVSNRCADMRMGIDAARLLVLEAAWALDAESAPPASSSVAKSYVDQVIDDVEASSHLVHGAMGFSTEYPLHLYTRMMKRFQMSWGSADSHLDRVASALDQARAAVVPTVRSSR
ncbi:acyl-CoA dehydrogenase family protein [Pseudonocardia xishanensis]|uniref:Acyl-CoA dehydrogenase family protein n=1 Tax=Pseudonocardia xishanensis TaxID=630995 RepID=A0ABP8S0N5_9PSEU